MSHPTVLNNKTRLLPQKKEKKNDNEDKGSKLLKTEHG